MQEFEVSYTVDFNHWRAGDGENAVGFGSTVLWNKEGYGCCLGHICLQMGAKKSQITGEGMPSGAADILGDIFPKLTYRRNKEFLNTQLSTQAATINDNPNITTKERIEKLQNLFAAQKIELIFINVPEEHKI